MSTAVEFEHAIAAGGVALFPADTVYGLACAPDDAGAIDRLYALKGRPPDKAAAVMFFRLEPALAALPELGPATQAALRALMPGGVMALLPNSRRRFPLACRADPATLGLRVVSVAALDGVALPVLQSSANPSGAADARRLTDVEPAIRSGVDLEVDGGELPGVASTVIDLRAYEVHRRWQIVRHGLVAAGVVAAVLDGA